MRTVLLTDVTLPFSIIVFCVFVCLVFCKFDQFIFGILFIISYMMLMVLIRVGCWVYVTNTRVCFTIKMYVQSESSMAPTETFAERIKRFDLEFTFVLIGLLKQINEIAYEDPNSKLINLVHRYVVLRFVPAHLRY